MDRRDRPFQIRSRSTFSVTRYPFIPNFTLDQCASGDDTSDHLPFNQSTQSPGGDCLTCKNYLSPGECPLDLRGSGDGEATDIEFENPTYVSESDRKSSASDTDAKENDYSTEARDTATTAMASSESPSSPCSPYEEPAVTAVDNRPAQSTIFFQGKKSRPGNLRPVTPGRKLSYGEMEAKLQALIIGKFARRKKSEMEAIGLSSSKNHSAQNEPRPIQTATSGSGTTFSSTTFRTSDWPFVSTVPHKKPLKPVLANFDKIEFFQAPFRRLPTPWLRRPETPLQKIYGSAVKQMPFETERDRRKLIDQAVMNGQLYRRIKRAKSEYNRHEQLRNFKKHEAFIRFKGPVANLESAHAKRNKFMSTNCYSYKPVDEINNEGTDLCDLKSIFEDDSPNITANQ